MAIARKAFVWGLFAAGGTLVALVFPVIIGLFFLLSAGYTPRNLEFEPLHSALQHWALALGFFVVLVLAAWHAAHRLRILVQDLGLRADRAVALVAYTLAGLFTLLTAFTLYLLQ